MKNKRIIQAYDSVNPSEADKARMLDVILAEADLKEEPRKQPERRSPNVRTTRPERKRRSNRFLPIAAALTMILVAGSLLVRIARRPEDISYIQPDSVNLGTPYDAVLSKYKTALEEGWTSRQCQIEDIYEFITSINYSALDVGYAIVDLDNNDREELVITNGQGLVWDLYTLLEDGTPVHVHTQEEGWPTYRLYENGVIGMEDIGSDGIVYEYYTFRDTAFTGPELVIRQGAGMFTCEPAGEEPYFITKEEAEGKMARYKLQELDQTSLLTLVSDEVAERYRYGNNVKLAGIIATYNQAIAEGWIKEQCQLEGISPRVQAGYDVVKAGYTFLDLDGDGREELIIAEESTDRTDNIWDLYTTLEDGTPIQLWVDELDGGQCRLCEDNIISISYSMKDELDQTFYNLEAGQLAMLGMLQWEDEDTVFHTDADGNTRQVTSREGQAIGYSYETKKLNLTWLGKHQDTDVLERYTPVLEKYRTALLENWDKDKCFENNISAIAAFGRDTRTALGWCLRDIDGNGTEELLISYGNESGSLVDLYCLQPENLREEDMVKSHSGVEYPLGVENGICHLAKSEGAIQYTLCTDGTIRYQIVVDGTTNWCDYLVKPWGLELQDVMIYKRDNENDKTYAYGPHENDLTYISKEKAGEFISAHKPFQLQVTPLVDWDIYEESEPDDPIGYDALIEIYRQAIRENWDPGKCIENGLSLMVGYYGDFVNDLGYAMMDLDSNGIQELIITDGTNIYDLYATVSDERAVPLKIIDATERNQYFLTTDGMIYNMGSGSALVSSYLLYRLNDLQMDLQEGYMMDAETDPVNPWFYYNGADKGDPCPTSVAAQVMDSIHFAEISFISFE